MSNNSISQDLQNDWNNGWKRLYEKSIQSKTTPQKALYFSAKDYIKLYRTQSSQSILEIINLTEVWNFIQFTNNVWKKIWVEKNGGKFCERIINQLTTVSQSVDNTLSNHVETISKDWFIAFWFEVLEKEVIHSMSNHWVQLSILLACKNHTETQGLTHWLYGGITSHLVSFSQTLQKLLWSKSARNEDILEAIYDGKTLPRELHYTSFNSKHFRRYNEKSSV